MSFNKKAPIIGEIFSSDSSDEDYKPKAKPIQSEPVKLRIALTSGGEQTTKEPKKYDMPADTPDGYVEINKTKLGSLRYNTLIQYIKNGKNVKPKYFKKFDVIANTILVGFSPKKKDKCYTENISDISNIYAISTNIQGGEDRLKGTILIPKQDWKTQLRRDMIISYKKTDGEYVYMSKFNSFVKTDNQLTRMSLTSERGFNFTASPEKIEKLYRHFSGNDRTMSIVLEQLKSLEMRLSKIEKLLSSKK